MLNIKKKLWKYNFYITITPVKGNSQNKVLDSIQF